MTDAKIACCTLQWYGNASGILKSIELNLRGLPDMIVYLIREIIFTEEDFTGEIGLNPEWRFYQRIDPESGYRYLAAIACTQW